MFDDELPARNWWGQKPAKKKALNFSNIANAIGLKAKKQPPPLDVQPKPRPSSKSTSTSTRSRVDSMEPRTPADSTRGRRQSLLTLSDTDPFAGRPIPTMPMPVDASRLSAYSNPSVTDLKKPDNCRISYASSSSHTGEHSPASPSPPVPAYTRAVRAKRSTGSLQVQKSEPLSRQATEPVRRMRPRGLTDSGAAPSAGFFVEERPQLSRTSSSRPSVNERPISPRVVVRQPSNSRLFSPPSAPPLQRLPATPQSSTDTHFPSARSDDAGRTFFAQQEASEAIRSRSLRKPLSHQSLQSPASLPKSPPPDSPAAEKPGKAPKKQKSFHHPRLPLPPLPAPDSLPPALDHKEQKRGSSTSSLGRRRLFSSSSREQNSSQASPAQEADDSRSMMSFRSDIDTHLSLFKPWILSQSSSSPNQSTSFWEEPNVEVIPSSPVRVSQESYYTPQSILSPEQRAKVEALSSPTSSRSRAFSLVSASTVASEHESESQHHPPVSSPRHSSRAHRKPPSILSASQFSMLDIDESPRPRQHLSSGASQKTVRPATTTGVTKGKGEEYQTSLPPPPRPRTQRGVLVTASDRADRPNTSPAPVSFAEPISPTSAPASMSKPPPVSFSRVSRTSTITSTISRTSTMNSRTPMSVEKVLHRRSIMKKSSFLDIDDDDSDDDSDPISDSFLDLTRESFDTVRTAA